MALNFPDSPTVGDTYTAAGRTWVWDGTTWNNDATATYDSIAFDTTANLTADIGEMVWNAEKDTVDLGLTPDVTLQVGQEQLMWVKNASGSTAIPRGTFVQFAGAAGDTVTVEPATTDGSVDHHYMIGITTEQIDADSFGYVTTYGIVIGLNTNVWPVGTVLYADPTTAGNLTATEPAAPNYRTPVAAVVKQGSGTSGKILVRMDAGEELGHLHDVQVTSVADGDTIQWNDSTSRWENTTGLAAFVTDATTARTVTSSDAGKTILFTSASAVTMTVDASTDFPVGARMDFVQDGAGVVTVTASGATIAAAETSTTTGSFTIGTQYSAATLLCVGTDSYRLIGNITAV